MQAIRAWSTGHTSEVIEPAEERPLPSSREAVTRSASRSDVTARRLAGSGQPRRARRSVIGRRTASAGVNLDTVVYTSATLLAAAVSRGARRAIGCGVLQAGQQSPHRRVAIAPNHQAGSDDVHPSTGARHQFCEGCGERWRTWPAALLAAQMRPTGGPARR
jgi:hypothetical protein